MAGSVMGKVTFVSKVPILMKATSDDMNPTPGYLFVDIAAITYESLDYCEYMVEFLVSRLKKKSIHVKLKVLLVIRHILSKGHDEFGRCLRRQSNSIQECKDIHGPPDPLCGDKYYLEIRKTVNEVLNLLFNIGSAQNSRENQPVNDIKGFGNVAPTPRIGMFQSMVDKIKDTVPSVLHTTGTERQDSLNSSHYQKYNDANSNTINCPSVTLWGFIEGRNKEQKINLAANSTSHQSGLSSRDSTKNTSWLVNRTDNQLPISSVNIMRKQEIDLFETEKRIVEEITTPQGIRPLPLKQELNQFIKKCETLSCEMVVNLLQEKLHNEDSRIQLRTMHVLEMMLQSNLTNISDIIKNTCLASLQRFNNTSHTATRNKAQKLLSILGLTSIDDISIKSDTPNSRVLKESENKILDLNESPLSSFSFDHNIASADDAKNVAALKSPYRSQFDDTKLSSNKHNNSNLLDLDPFNTDRESGVQNSQFSFLRTDMPTTDTTKDFDEFQGFLSNPNQEFTSKTTENKNSLQNKNFLGPLQTVHDDKEHSSFLPVHSGITPKNITENSFDIFQPTVVDPPANASQQSGCNKLSNEDFFSSFDQLNISSSGTKPKQNSRTSDEFDLFAGLNIQGTTTTTKPSDVKHHQGSLMATAPSVNQPLPNTFVSNVSDTSNSNLLSMANQGNNSNTHLHGQLANQLCSNFQTIGMSSQISGNLVNINSSNQTNLNMWNSLQTMQSMSPYTSTHKQNHWPYEISTYNQVHHAGPIQGTNQIQHSQNLLRFSGPNTTRPTYPQPYSLQVHNAMRPPGIPLGMQPQGNSFNFINQTTSEKKPVDSFSFVQDAMKATKRK